MPAALDTVPTKAATALSITCLPRPMVLAKVRSPIDSERNRDRVVVPTNETAAAIGRLVCLFSVLANDRTALKATA